MIPNFNKKKRKRQKMYQKPEKIINESPSQTLNVEKTTTTIDIR